MQSTQFGKQIFIKGQRQGEMTQLPGYINSLLESSRGKLQATIPCKY